MCILLNMLLFVARIIIAFFNVVNVLQVMLDQADVSRVNHRLNFATPEGRCQVMSDG